MGKSVTGRIVPRAEMGASGKCLPQPPFLRGSLASPVRYIQPSSFRVQDAFQTLYIFATLPSSFMVSA